MRIDWQDYHELKILRNRLEKYEPLEYIGCGGCSKVFKINDRSRGRICALKVLDLQKLEQCVTETGIEMKIRFIKEAGAYRKCSHPNIVSIYDVGGDDTCPYIIMEFIDGKCLDKLISEKITLELTEILEISASILQALQYMHFIGLIHRDLKPANIMIEEDSSRIVLIDFGIIKDFNSSGLTITDSYMGSPYYSSPEQWKDSKRVDYRTDIYAFGVILYKMVTGQVPFNGSRFEVMDQHLKEPVPHVKFLNPQAPPGIQEIIEKAMAKKADKRYREPGELLTALKKIAQGANG